jgi:hypothetical protein
MLIDLEETYTVGEDTYFTSNSPSCIHAVAFEDDTRTGYFYAIDLQTKRILDAVHIYNDEDVIDKDKPSNLQIVWTEDGSVSSLLINNYCHAIIDFKNNACYSRTGFPETKGDWAPNKNRKLTDELIDKIFNIQS